MEMERFKYRAGEEDLGAVALVLAGEGLRAGQSPCGVGLGDALQLHKEDLTCALWALRATEGEFSSKDVWRNRSEPARQSCQGQSGVACFCVLCCKTH